jgi:hypothetical protein
LTLESISNGQEHFYLTPRALAGRNDLLHGMLAPTGNEVALVELHHRVVRFAARASGRAGQLARDQVLAVRKHLASRTARDGLIFLPSLQPSFTGEWAGVCRNARTSGCLFA